MGLSSDLISQFVKVTKDEKPKSTEATVYGTVVDQDGDLYVQLDGSDVLTPVSSTVKMESGERVIVRIKDHTAVVTGNLTTQSARSDDLDDVVNEITEVEILVADKVSTSELDAERARIDELVAENATITGRLEASEAVISELEADNATINGTLTAFEAEIKKLSAEKLDAEFAEITYATIGNLHAIDAQIYNLSVTYGTFMDVTAEHLEALDAEITNLEAEYATIDFANIGSAAIENFFALSGIIEDLVVSDGNITGTLTAVDINADYINTGTLKAERLILLGEDGLFHEINVAAGAITEGEVVPDDSIHGSVITAKSITANQIFVNDLIAFDATIGGFKIGTNSLYSGVKESIDNSTRGVYMDTDGQVYFGDADNYLRYCKYPFEEPVELTLMPNKMLASANGSVSDFNNKDMVVSEPIVITDCDSVVITAWACVNRYAYAFYDSNDTFIIGLAIPEPAYSSTGVTNTVVSIPDGAVTLRIAGEMTVLPPALAKIRYKYKLEISAESILFGANAKRSVADLQALTEHVKIGTYVDPETGNEQPSVELAEGDTDFKQVITNTKTMFMDGDNVGTEINTEGLETENVTVRSELRQGNWVWAQRANGNYGLIWKEATA